MSQGVGGPEPGGACLREPCGSHRWGCENRRSRGLQPDSGRGWGRVTGHSPAGPEAGEGQAAKSSPNLRGTTRWGQVSKASEPCPPYLSPGSAPCSAGLAAAILPAPPVSSTVQRGRPCWCPSWRGRGRWPCPVQGHPLSGGAASLPGVGPPHLSAHPSACIYYPHSRGLRGARGGRESHERMWVPGSTHPSSRELLPGRCAQRQWVQSPRPFAALAEGGAGWALA